MQLIYPPLFYYLAAASSLLLGPTFFSVRIVSLICTIIICYLLAKIVNKETNSKFFLVVSVGLFLGAFRTTGAWYDLARVDMLFHAILMGSFYILLYKPEFKFMFVTAILLFLASITKQSAIIVIGAFFLLYWISHRFWAFILVGTSLVAQLVFTHWFDVQHQGWYSYTLVNLVKAHTIEKPMIWQFWTHDLLLSGGALLLLFTMLTVNLAKNHMATQRNIKLFFVYFVMLLVLSYGGRLFKGGYTNALISVYMGLALVVPILAHNFLENFSKTDYTKTKAKCVLWLFLILQFYLFSYNPLKQIPTEKDRAAGEFIVNMIKDFDGPVWVPSHGYLADKAGKKPYAQMSSLIEIGGLLGKGHIIDENGEEIVKELQDKIRNQEFDAIMLDYDINWIIPSEELSRYYINSGAIFESMPGYVFFPVTGFETRPMSLYLPVDKSL